MLFTCFAPNCTSICPYSRTTTPAVPPSPFFVDCASSNAVVRCSKCNLACYCSEQCAKTHKEEECGMIQSTTMYKSLVSFLLQARNKGWSHCVRQLLSLSDTVATEADVFGCWTTVFAMARAVGGNEAVEVLCAKRINMESMLLGMNWDEDQQETADLRDGCVKRCVILQETENPAPLICWLMPGENYMFNSPHREENHSYDHVFAAVPFGVDQLLLLQSVDGNVRINVVDRRLFWSDVHTIVSSTNWNSSVTACYKRAFGVERDFTGREMAVFFDATLFDSAVCASCGCKTAPKHCARCQRATYCSRTCQQAHWSSGGHKSECKKIAM